MNNELQQLHAITESMLNSTCENSVEADKLYSFFNQFESSKDLEGDIQLLNGIALSKEHAGDCIKDYKRTVKFLQSIYLAINETIEKFKGTKLNILYAGSGPFGTLIVPLLSFFNESQLSVTFLDINKSSIKSLKNIVSKLELSPFVSEILETDATTYQFTKNKELHMVVSETMFHALTKEPQVAVTQNFAPQIIEGGVLIPEEIEVSMGFSFFSKEPYLNQYNNEYYIANNENKELERASFETLFRLNKNSFKNKQLTHNFESKNLEKPLNFQNKPDLCIYTKIKIYKNLVLTNEDSLITNPYCLTSLYNIPQDSSFKIKYNISVSPNWEIAIC